MGYAQIVFAQGDEGRELVDKIERVEGVVAHGPTPETVVTAVEYLAQWDYGDESEHDVRDSSSRGSTLSWPG